MVQDEIHERFGLPRERLPVIYNAIDPGRVQSGARRRIATPCARATASPHDACVFLLVGLGVRAQGRGARARGARAACRRRRTSSWWDATAIRRATQRSRSSCGVAERVTFAGAQTDPRPFYGAADAFVLPTLYDALSNAVLEALACGLPVVTSDRCGAGELVRAHGAGAVCGARDIEAIAGGDARRCSTATRARATASGTRSRRWPTSRRRRWRRASSRCTSAAAASAGLAGATLYFAATWRALAPRARRH